MRTSFLLLAATLLSTGFASSATIATWSPLSFAPGAPYEPFDFAANVNVSNIEGNGGLTSAGTFRYRGFSTTIDTGIYAGFTVQAGSGNSLTITDFTYATVVSSGNATAFQWGYRVNEGSGFGAWTLGELHERGEVGFAPTVPDEHTKNWDMPDFTTTGVVEFGLFAAAPDATGQVLVSLTQGPTLNGSVQAVPEPSALLLSAAGALVAFRRRR